jgi:uncharacterized protein YerC
MEFTRIKSYKGEQWKPITLPDNFESAVNYYISNFGRIVSVWGSRETLKVNHLSSNIPYFKISLKRKLTSKQQKELDTLENKITKAKNSLKFLSKNKKAYKSEITALNNELKELTKQKKAILKKQRYNYSESVAKIVAKNFIGPPPTSEHIYAVNINYNYHDNKVSNIKWVTQKEFTEHHKKNPNVIQAKRLRKLNPIITNSRLTEKDVIRIKKLLADGKTLKFIANKFGISDMQVSRIKSGENWGHITIDEKPTKTKKEKSSNKSLKKIAKK